MARPSNILISTVKRNQRFRGPTFSDQQNDFQSEIIRDLSVFQQQWNNNIVPLTSVLPDGTEDSEVNAFQSGLDGQTFYVKHDATATLANGNFYNAVKDRANTVYEQFVNVYTYIDEQIDILQASIVSNNSGTGITAEQKTRIGDHIFDLSQTSLSTSLDGKVTSQAGYITQIARDMYGTNSPTLNSSGAAILNNSVKDMVDALLELHAGNWDTDASVAHSNFDASVITTGTFAQNRVGPSSSAGGVNDSYVGVPANTVDDLNQVRTLLKVFKGTAAFNSTITPNGTWSGVTTQPDSFIDLIAAKGSGTRSDTNPWGYHHSDIEGLTAILNAVQLFTGQDSSTDSTPTYGAVNGFSQGDSLETAIGALASGLLLTDAFAIAVSGLISAHTQNVSNPHDTTLTQVASEGGSAPALQVSITDAGSFFTSANVEGALQELGSSSGTSFVSMSQFTNSGLTIADDIYSTYVDTQGSDKLILLPDVTEVPDQSFVIKKIDSTSGTITLSGLIGDLIDFSSTFVFSGYLESVTTQATASGYFII